MNSLVESLIPERKGTFENKWAQYIDEFDVYGTTIKRKMFEGNERALLAKKLRQMKVHMKKHINEEIQFGAGFEHYFVLHHNETNGMFQFPEDRTDVIERENNLSGYFCIITSENMTAKEALLLYKNRDASEIGKILKEAK